MAERRPRAALRLPAVAGVRFEMHASSAILLAGLAVLLATQLLPRRAAPLSPLETWGVAAASALVLFASVLAHEIAHVVVARLAGVRIERVTLFFHAGHASDAPESPTPVREALIALAGPALTFVASALAWWAWKGLPEQRLVTPLLEFATIANALLGLVHVLPAHPFDGARVVAALAWQATGSRTAGLAWSARLTQALALGLAAACALGVALRGLGSGWTWGLLLAAGAWLQGVLVARLALQRERLAGRIVADVMTPPPEPLPRVTSVADALLLAASTGVEGWLVEFSERLGGTVGVRELRSVPADERFVTPVGQVARRLERSHVLSPTTHLEDAVRLMARDRLAIAPVVHDGTVVGALTRRTVHALLDGRPPVGSPA